MIITKAPDAMAPKRKLSDTSGITMLGSGEKNLPTKKLESFPFRHQDRVTTVTFKCTEFTCHCPVTGQPDYATLDIEYIPAARALESKSLKNYLWSFRNEPAFHEDVVNVILDEIFDFLKPRWMRITGHFNIRGGIAIDVTAERGKRE